MHFTKLFSLLAAAALASANTVTFTSLDDTDRTVYFTPNAGLAWLPSVKVPARGTVKVEFPLSWIGNWYSVCEGAPNVPGMLGEVAFDGWLGMTFYDVSAIVKPDDTVGVKEIWPAGSKHPTSGCKIFPCNNAYYLPDDVQTKATTEKDLICSLGVETVAARSEEAAESPSFKRDFVEGRWTR